MPWDYLDLETGQLRPGSCKSVWCEVCGPYEAKRRAWRVANMLPPRFATFTDLPADFQEARRWEARLLARLRRRGYVIEWAISHELTRKGSRHAHAVLRPDYIPQRVLSEQAHAAGAGYVVDIRRVRDRGGTAYALKEALRVVGYSTKGVESLHEHLRLNGGRVCRTTRGYFKP